MSLGQGQEEKLSAGCHLLPPGKLSSLLKAVFLGREPQLLWWAQFPGLEGNLSYRIQGTRGYSRSGTEPESRFHCQHQEFLYGAGSIA